MLLMIVIDFVRYGVSVSKLQGVSLVRCWEKGNKYFFKYHHVQVRTYLSESTVLCSIM